MKVQLCYLLCDTLDPRTWKSPGAIGRPELGEKPPCIPGHQRVTIQEVWGSCAFALLPSSRSNPLPPSPSASLFLIFGRLLLPGWGLRNLALKSDIGASGFFNQPDPGILDERLLVSPRRASLRGITRRICLRPGSSQRRSHGLCLSWWWLRSGPSNLGPHSDELSVHMLSERAELFMEVLCCCLSCSRVISLIAPCMGPFVNFGLKGSQALLNAFARRYSISLSSAAWSCMVARSSLFSTTQNMYLVKRVISAAQPASESMTHLFFLQWAQRNFCFSGPFLPFWAPIGSVPKRWVAMAP